MGTRLGHQGEDGGEGGERGERGRRQMLVADTVRGLCSGKDFLFADRGEFVAKLVQGAGPHVRGELAE